MLMLVALTVAVVLLMYAVTTAGKGSTPTGPSTPPSPTSSVEPTVGPPP
jgi:hypothetical protein